MWQLYFTLDYCTVQSQPKDWVWPLSRQATAPLKESPQQNQTKWYTTHMLCLDSSPVGTIRDVVFTGD
jgi:hypothetical protein